MRETPSKLKSLIMPVIMLIALIAGITTFFITQSTPDKPQAKALNRLPEFSLTLDDNSTMNRDSLKGQWSMLFFGYTFCPDVCPTALSVLNQVQLKLSDTKNLEYIFVSVDPQRDKPERLGEYVRFFNEGFRGATGTREQIDLITGGLYIPYIIGEPDMDGIYTVDHSGSFVLVGPDQQVYKYFSAPHNPQTIADELKSLING